MRIEFSNIWLLLLLPIAAGVTLWIDHRYRPRGRNLRRFSTLAARLLLLILLCLALAAPTLYIGSNNYATWVLIDGSASMKGARSEAEQLTKAALFDLADDLQAGVIGFGRLAMVEAPLSHAPKFTALKTEIDESATSAAGALRLAGAMLPQDVSGRIVLISDGRFQDVSGEAALLAARGIAVDTLMLTPEAADDAQVTRVTVPSHVYQNQQFHVTVELYSNFNTVGTLVLSANRQPVATRAVELRKGANTFVFQDVAQVSGVVTYEAQLAAEGDAVSQNDRLGAYLAVEGIPTVLLVEGRAGGANELRRMLEAAGMAVEKVTPDALSPDAEALRKYDAVVLGNVDAAQFPAGSIDALKRAVRTLGRGLLVVGGDSSYALGDYRGSELEELLPVTIDVRNQMDMPAVALVLAIDKSGSMTEQMFGVTRLDMAREGAARSVEVLTARDSVGVIAFDDTAKWAVPLIKAEDIPAIQNQIATIRPGGGTAFFSPLYEAYQALTAIDAPLKHVIFLSDGDPGDSGFQSIAAAMQGDGITLTTVAVGSGANMTLLKQLSDLGGGRCYAAGEFDNLPKIFTKETYLITGSYVQNRTFTPVITEQSSLTAFDALPQVDGYLASTVKPLATLSLATDRDDPLMAWWQYGAGRVLCWTSDSEGAWTKQLLGWAQSPAFFGGMVGKVLQDGSQSGSLTVTPTESGIHIAYEQPEGAPLEGARTQAVVLLPDGSEQTVELVEQAPGQFAAEMPQGAQGAYAVRVEQIEGGQIARSLEGGMVKPYASEYDLTRSADGGVLARLSALTGGQVLTDGSQLLEGRGGRVQAGRELQRLLLILSVCVFLVDVALRRLAWDRAAYAQFERQKARRAQRVQRAKAKPAPLQEPTADAPATPTPSTADALLNRRDQKKRL